jgi:phytol kinase
MEQIIAVLTGRQGIFQYATELRTEILRKSIHFLIGLVPILAMMNLSMTVALLGSGIIVYAYCETMRLQGYEVVLVSRLTAAAARQRDAGKFVLGPITLGLGAMISLLLYPMPAASIAIYALAFGDGLSSLVGRLFGTVRLPFTGGKTIEGSLACFVAVLICSYGITNRLAPSVFIAAAATIIEVIPTKDYDNILLPASVGLIAVFII